MKTQRELNVHYWCDIHDMIYAYNNAHPGADVKPWECVKLDGYAWRSAITYPTFHCDPGRYQFAVAILFDEQAEIHKPVFLGDTVYLIDGGRSLTVMSDTQECITSKYWSWHKPQPKRTFEINGVELPCPMKDAPECNFDEHTTIYFNAKEFYFDSLADKDKWEHAFANLLTEAREK